MDLLLNYLKYKNFLFIADWTSELVYFFTPVFALVVCNVVLFSITAHRIRSIRQETAILKSSESSRSDKLRKDKQRYFFYFLIQRQNACIKKSITENNFHIIIFLVSVYLIVTLLCTLYHILDSTCDLGSSVFSLIITIV